MPLDAEPEQSSLLSWALSTLGGWYTILLPLAGLLCLLLTVVVVFRGKGPMAAASLILIVNVPLLIGVFAALQGAIASYAMIATSSSTPKPADIATGISTALIAPLVGILVMIPSYVAAVLGAFIRSLLPSGRE